MNKCPICKEKASRKNHAYCNDCHAAYMRENRLKHSELNDEQRKRATARAYANTYKRRGKLKQEPCEQCHGEDSQMHHEDYDKPLEVTWLCRDCHLEHHKQNN